MKSVHKLVVTGAFGGLAAATVIGSGAFACTPDRSVSISVAGSPFDKVGQVTPGQEFVVKTDHFYPTDYKTAAQGTGADAQEVQVLDASGTPIVEDPMRVELTWQDPVTKREWKVSEGFGKTFEQTLRIPAEFYNTSPTEPYLLSATQYNKDGVQQFSNSARVLVTGGAARPKGAGPAEFDADAYRRGLAQQQQGSTSQGAGLTGPAQGGATAGSVAGIGTAPQPGAVASGQGSTSSGAQAGTPAAQRAANPVVPVAVGAPTLPNAEAEAASGDLWSGLSAERTPSLLDTQVPARQSSGIPAGGLLLLGTGALAMAGAAFEATRRRLALVRTRR